MKTAFPKTEYHVPKWFVIDATGETLGRLATETSKLLRGKETSFFTPGIDQGNYVVILNAEKITITGKKEFQKLYYRNSQRPGNLKIETFKQLKNRMPSKILENAIYGMLPKGVLGRNYFRRLYIYSQNQISYKKTKDGDSKVIPYHLAESENWIQIKISEKVN